MTEQQRKNLGSLLACAAILELAVTRGMLLSVIDDVCEHIRKDFGS